MSTTFLKEDYQLGCPSGVWLARLDYKDWGKSHGADRLFFTDLNTQNKYFFSVFGTNDYKAISGGIDFYREAIEGQCFKLTTGLTRTGKPKFLAAQLKPIATENGAGG